MLWENSSVAVAVAHPDLGNGQFIGFHYKRGASGVRGSIRLVFRVPLERELRKVVVQQIEMLKKSRNQQKKTAETGIA